MDRFGDHFRFTLITNDPKLAAKADSSGINRIGLDLERVGKAERQARHDTRLSQHMTGDIAAIKESLSNAELFVRLNPLNTGSEDEIERVLRGGAKVLMLPFFRTAAEVDAFIRLVKGRARTMILVETAAAVVRIREILAVPGVDEVMVGLNDLRLELGVDSHFEILASPVLDMLAREVLRARLPFSVGGVARLDDLLLPVPPDLVLAQFPRLGATGAWISRSFMRDMQPDWDFAGAVRAVRQRLNEWARASTQALECARDDLLERAREMVLRSKQRERIRLRVVGGR